MPCPPLLLAYLLPQQYGRALQGNAHQFVGIPCDGGCPGEKGGGGVYLRRTALPAQEGADTQLRLGAISTDYFARNKTGFACLLVCLKSLDETLSNKACVTCWIPSSGAPTSVIRAKC